MDLFRMEVDGWGKNTMAAGAELTIKPQVAKMQPTSWPVECIGQRDNRSCRYLPL
jgi:hypothetical protein